MERSQLSIVHVLIIVLVAVLGAAFVFRPGYHGGSSYVVPRCLSNVKQLGSSIQLYLGDYDERMPLNDWSVELGPYIGGTNHYHCPQLQKEAREAKAKVIDRYGYAMHSAVMGKSATKIDSQEVVFFETDALAPGVVANLAARSTTRHNNKSVIGYMDSSARRRP